MSIWSDYERKEIDLQSQLDLVYYFLRASKGQLYQEELDGILRVISEVQTVVDKLSRVGEQKKNGAISA